MARDNHFISRFLTKRWELNDRSLWVYDFKRQSLERRASKSLFVGNGLWSDALETLFDRDFENTVGAYLDRCDKAHGGMLVDDGDPKLGRALTNLILTLAHRGAAASGRPDVAQELEKMTGFSEQDWAQSAVVDHAMFRLLSIMPPSGDELFFPSTGVWPLPLAIPAFTLSVSPKACVALVPRAIQDAQLQQFVKTRGLLAELSVGMPPNALKVVVPPTSALFEADQRRLLDAIPEIRGRTERRVNAAADLQKMREFSSKENMARAVAQMASRAKPN